MLLDHDDQKTARHQQEFMIDRAQGCMIRSQWQPLFSFVGDIFQQETTK